MIEIKNIDEFNNLTKQELIVVIAKTHTCGVCEPIANKLTEFMKNYQDIPNYQIFVEDVPEFSGQNLIFTVPTIMIYSNSKEVLRESRFINFSNIKRLLDIYTEK